MDPNKQTPVNPNPSPSPTPPPSEVPSAPTPPPTPLVTPEAPSPPPQEPMPVSVPTAEPESVSVTSPTTPLASPTPTTPGVVTAQPQPQTPQPAGPVTQADFMALAKKDRNPKKWFAALGAVIVVVGVVAALHFTGIFPLTKFKTVSYDNGKGSTYSVKFYSKYKVEKAGDLEKQFGDAANVLAAKQGKDGKAPMQMLISDASTKELGGSGYLEILTNCNKKDPVVKVYNEASKKDVLVCDFGNILGGTSDLDNVIYSAFFNQGDRSVIVLFLSTAINEDALTSSAKAKEALEKAKLDVYKDDIGKIVGSVKIEKHK